MLEPMTDALTAALAARLPEGVLREITPAYLEEPRSKYPGRDAVLALPGSTEEVAEIVRFAAAHRVGLLPRGGGTGLVGGQVMPDKAPKPILVSLERMRAVRDIHAAENAMVVEAGCVLADVQAAAEQAGRLFPLSLGSEGSARMGGLLSTNAGGVNVLRYGNTRDLVLGIEAVLPDGQVFNGLRRLRKDNTGYDLRHLLIGAEGTLGIITAAALRLYPRPPETGAAVLVVESPDAALRLLNLAQQIAGPGLSAFELISGQGLAFQREMGMDTRQPFEEVPNWAVLIDLGLPQGEAPQEMLEQIFAAGFEEELVSDGVVAQNEAQRQDFWLMREGIPEANRLVGAVASHDISLPLSLVPAFIDTAGVALAELGLRINCFGHLGDGNLHYNVFPPQGEARDAHLHLAAKATRIVHDLVMAHDGSFSAEHGVGRAKVGDLERYGDPAKLWAMRAIKGALDPLGIMNPGAVLRPSC
jgi:FAD/FMN-containing dehydrogenase